MRGETPRERGLTVELNIKERLVLSQALPREGNLVRMRMVQDLQQRLGFSEEEQEAIGFEQEGEQVRWKQDIVLVKDVALGPRALVLILDTLRAADQGNKLTLDLLELCNRFGYPEGERGAVDEIIRVEDLQAMLGGPDAVAHLVELAKQAQGQALELVGTLDEEGKAALVPEVEALAAQIKALDDVEEELAEGSPKELDGAEDPE